MITITLRQMSYFTALAETRHFGRAADLCKVTQPALSAQIAEMEQRLGQRLFERTGRAALLTAEGESLRPAIERVLADARALEASARRGRGLLEGRFRLGIIPTVAPYLLPRLLAEASSRFPALALEIREAVTATLIEEAVAGSLDALIAADPIDHPALVTEHLFDDRFFLAAAVDDTAFARPPVAPEAPLLERLMLLEEGHCLRDQALALCGEVRPVTLARYGATSLATLLAMVGAGLGVTLLPEMAVASERGRPDLRIVPFAPPEPGRRIVLAWRASAGRQAEHASLAGLVRGSRPLLPASC